MCEELLYGIVGWSYERNDIYVDFDLTCGLK